jgi:hypothetical protein
MAASVEDTAASVEGMAVEEVMVEVVAEVMGTSWPHNCSP